MHATRGGWVGQTFALSKCNDSGEKKSRIRRSKEERKTMVESFIKKYQKLNNGSFPSLNLTHKEVGGSFYTVREIVRDVIQENRVLGPAKLTTEEENYNRSLEIEYQLGSIAIEAQVSPLSSNEAHAVDHILLPNHHQVITGELVLNSSEQYPGPELLHFDDGKVINGSSNSEAVKEIEESNGRTSRNLLGSDSLEVAENLVEVKASKAKGTHIPGAVVVEAFPLKSVTKVNYDVDGEAREMRELAGASKERGMEKLGLEEDSKYDVLESINFLESYSVSMNEKAETKHADQALEDDGHSVDDKELKIVGDPLLENSNGTITNEGSVLDIHDCKELEGAPSTEVVSTYATNRNHGKNLENTEANSCSGPVKSNGTIPVNKIPEIQHVGESQQQQQQQQQGKPTLDRINLESWERPCEKPTRADTNPLFSFVRSFITAFVKFWTEE